MAWENIENRLLEPFKLKTVFPQGVVWLPESQLSVDEWLTFIADTDEELREVDIQKMRFLQNRWLVDKLIQLKWENPPDRRSVWSMWVKERAYILFFDGIDYHVIAAIAPATAPELYRAVISKLLLNRSFVPERVTSKRIVRPDLLGDLETALVAEAASASQDQKIASPDYVSKLLVGWVGGWIDLPVLGFWHEDQPHSVEAFEEGKYVMRYKPSYGDKQREAQKRRKKEEQGKQSEAPPESEQAPKNVETSEKEQKRSA